ncbi:hypothetical protein [Natronorarus salvus]|uniref:hypothetical protein n=1 Tax=Natronorarus salvus TaxID=3117733 RepID=UPI002F262122
MDEPRWWYLVLVAYGLAPLAVPVLLVWWSLSRSFSSFGGVGGVQTLLAVLLPNALALAVVVVTVPVGVYCDARAVRRLGWEPNARRWLLASIVFPISLVTAGAYLYRRKRAVGLAGIGREEPLSREEIERSRWWTLAPVGALGGPLVLVSLLVVPPLLLGSSALLLVAYAGVVSLALYSLGVWVDRARIHDSEVDWSPSHLWFAAAFLGLPGVLVAGIAYPVVRRRKLRRNEATDGDRSASGEGRACRTCDEPFGDAAFCVGCGRHATATRPGLVVSYVVAFLVVIVGVSHLAYPEIRSDLLVGVGWTVLGSVVFPPVQRWLRRCGVELGRWTAWVVLILGVVVIEQLVISLDGPL